jgi:hypothetical protein
MVFANQIVIYGEITRESAESGGTNRKKRTGTNMGWGRGFKRKDLTTKD